MSNYGKHPEKDFHESTRYFNRESPSRERPYDHRLDMQVEKITPVHRAEPYDPFSALPKDLQETVKKRLRSPRAQLTAIRLATRTPSALKRQFNAPQLVYNESLDSDGFWHWIIWKAKQIVSGREDTYPGFNPGKRILRKK